MKPFYRNSAMLLFILACYPSGSLAGPLEAGRFASNDFDPVPLHLGARAFEIGSCRAWSKSNAWDTCQDYLDRYSLTMPQFYKLNPSVQSDCFSFVPGETYCRRTTANIPTSPDGTCGLHTGTNFTCIDSGFGDCCGANDRCGSTDAYCAIGNCQEGNCPGLGYTTDGFCGKDHAFLECGGRWGKCCSNVGRCGSTAAECGIGNCQSGACEGSASTSTVSASTVSPTSVIPAPTPFSPSPDGTCGYNNQYKCTDTNFYYGNCCGAAGYCGFSEWECSNLRGCQSEFGLCDTTIIVSPGGTATSTSAQPTSTGPVVVQKSGAYELDSCWHRPFDSRALSNSYSDPEMTVEKCLARASGYAYAGVEFGEECWYGNTLSGGYSEPLSACNMPCAGAPDAQFCGSGDRMLLYKIPGSTSPQPSQPALVVVGTRVPIRWHFVECRSDAGGDRSLTGASFTRDDMSLQTCASLCAGFTYFGAEFGKECYCGNSFSAGSSAPATDCTMFCAGDPKQYCGSGNRMSVYQNR